MRSQRRHSDRGYSLVEVLVTVVLFTAVAGIVYGLIARTQQVTRTTAASTMSQAQLVDAVNRVTRDVAGSQRIVTAQKGTLAVEVKNSTTCRLTQYSIADGDGDTIPDLISQSASGGACPAGVATAAKKVVVQSLNGGAAATVFTYVGEDGKAMTAPVAAADLNSIALVRVEVSVLVKGRVNPLRLYSSAAPRTATTPTGSESSVTVAPATVTFPDGPATGDCNATYRVTWNPSLGVTSYTVFVNGSQAATISDPSITYYDLTGMTNGQSYTVQVYATGTGGTSPTAGQQVVTRCPAAPVITGTRVNADSGPAANDNQITWPNVPGATSYTIYRDGAPVGNAAQSGTGTVNWLDYNRPWGSTSTYYVTAKNAGGEGTSSNTVSISQLPAPPVLTGTEADGYNDLSWNAVPTATSYEVWGDNGSGAVLIGTTTGNTATTYRHNSPGWGTTFDYYVLAINSEGKSLPSNTVTLLQPPGPFSLTSATTREWDRYTGNNGETLSSDLGGLRVIWSAASAAASYEVNHNRTAGVVATVAAPTRAWPATSGTYANATPGQTYTFTIDAIAANGKVRTSAPKTVLVDPAPPRYMWAGTWCNVTYNNSGWKFGMKWEPAPLSGSSDGAKLEEWRYRRIDSMDVSAGYYWDNLERTTNVANSTTRRTTLFGGTATGTTYLIQNPEGYGGRYKVFNYRSATFDFGDNESGILSVTGTKQGPDPVVCPSGQTTWDWNGNTVNIRIRDAY